MFPQRFQFSDLFLQLPTYVADNAGYDSAELISQMRAEHAENRITSGLSKFSVTVLRCGPSPVASRGNFFNYLSQICMTVWWMT